MVLTCREMSLIWTSSVLHLPKSLISGVSATAGAVSHSVTEDGEKNEGLIQAKETKSRKNEALHISPGFVISCLSEKYKLQCCSWY